MKKVKNSEINVSAVVGYPVRIPSENKGVDGMIQREPEPKMVVSCMSCGQEFDSTFSVEDFAALSKEQHEAGTLHLCPFCGNLSIYEMKDYHERQTPGSS